MKKHLLLCVMIIVCLFVLAACNEYSEFIGLRHCFDTAWNYGGVLVRRAVCVDGEKIDVFISIDRTEDAVRNELRPGVGKKQEGDELRVMQDNPFANPDSLAPLDYDYNANNTDKTSMALSAWKKELLRYLDGYKPSGIFLELNDNRRNKDYITEIYSEDGQIDKGSMIYFHDSRNISVEEKQAWQIQVIKDILANMKCCYWAAPEA